MRKSFTEFVQATTGGIAAVTALAATAGQFFPQLDELYKFIRNTVSIWTLWSLAALLLVVGFWLLWRGLSRKSRLLWPEALLIDPDNPDHLRGRQDEIRRLSDAIASHRLVFLEGESGSGKSALIRSGLIPALSDARAGAGLVSAMLPIYVNTYAQDWDQGVHEQLVDAAWRRFGDKLRKKLDVETRDDLRENLLSADDTTSLLARVRNELGLIPLFIFDQFDDYQVAHRDRFLRDGRWITDDELVEHNALWRKIRAELERGSLHLLVVTRRELFAGLEAVRFDRPEIYSLDRVEPVFITALLEQLVAPLSDDKEVVANPDAGWVSLKNRLVEDLSAQGRVLPIQARIVFKGLTELPYLNVGAFERLGGIDGLEAAYIEDAVSSAAGAAGVSEARVFSVLLVLVDNSDPELPKARTDDATALCSAAGTELDRLDRMLDVLTQAGVVRPRIGDEAKNGGAWWSLYHDYLGKAVLAAHRRANRWQRLLQDRLRALNEGTGWRNCWRALLSPWDLIRLIGPTLGGKVRWTGYRSFAFASTLRLLPLIAALSVIVIGGDQAMDWQARQEVFPILTGIRSAEEDKFLSSEAHSQLWSLAASAPRLKRAFVERSITSQRSHRALISHLGPVAQSIFGLDPDAALRHWTLDHLLGTEAATPYQALLAAWIWQSAPEKFKGAGRSVAETFVNAMAATTDRDQLGWLEEGLAGLGDKLPADQAAAGAKRLVQAMAATTDPYQLGWLGESLGGLGDTLPADQSAAGAKRLVQVMATTTDPDQLGRLGAGLGGLGDRLPADQATAGAKRLVHAIAQTTDPDQLGKLGAGLGGLGDTLPAKLATAGAKRLVQTMAVTTDPDQLGRLGAGLGGLGDKLPADQAAAGAKRLVQAMAATTYQTAFINLAEALASIQLGPDPVAIGTALDLLQAPLATGKTRDHLLRYYGRLAGRDLKTTDSFVAWARINRPDLDLTRLPLNPFR
jgi:hypothetical protein